MLTQNLLCRLLDEINPIYKAFAGDKTQVEVVKGEYATGFLTQVIIALYLY